MKNEHQFLGLGKTKFHSSICLLTPGAVDNAQLLLTERITRQKSSGAWPLEPLQQIRPFLDYQILSMAENRDVHRPTLIEDLYDHNFPFYEHLRKKGLEQFTSKFNPALHFFTHHEAHAYAALAMSPFRKSLIVVLDGAGSADSDFENAQSNCQHEECSVYLQNNGVVECVDKRWIKFTKSTKHPAHTFSEGIGTLYEKASEYIFNCSTSSGKVMGLAPFGKALPFEETFTFLENLEWENAYAGKNKSEWESSEHFTDYCNLAATVQKALEDDYAKLLISLKNKYPDYENLILTGGVALNCTNNAKILAQKLFSKIYVLPFPGDESISFGLAQKLYLKNSPERWMPLNFENQSAYFGPLDSIPEKNKVEQLLSATKFKVQYFEDITTVAAKELEGGNVIGWFQGRSESGPRALGNRSILARADRPGIKNYLNQRIKFRENFRPYGCSALHDKAHLYFDIEEGFDNPYMSYALQVRQDYKDALSEVSHVDGTSRMQTVRRGQNNIFYELIEKFGMKSNLYCLLNTSMNVMGEPIVETVEDALRFFEKTAVDSLYVGNFQIRRQ